MKKDFSYINKYEASFIVALLDYVCQLIFKKITGNKILYDEKESSESSEDE